MFRDSSSLGLSPQDVDKLLCLAALVEISRRMDELWIGCWDKRKVPPESETPYGTLPRLRSLYWTFCVDEEGFGQGTDGSSPMDAVTRSRRYAGSVRRHDKQVVNLSLYF